MNQTEIDYWNGRAGVKWAAMQPSHDTMLVECTAELKRRVGQVSGQRVLDIGCGAGETCAIWLEGGADVTGVDVSRPLLALARERTHGQVTLVEADAAVWLGDAPFDLAVSRFGLMFFEDADVAFSNIAANLRPGGRLLFACWRAMDENAWVTTPLRAIADLLQKVPQAPQAFSLCDAERLRSILGRAGFADLAIEAADIPLCVASEGGSATASRFLLQFGPAAAALAKTAPDVQTLGEERIRCVLAEHERNGQVMLGGAIWFVSAIRH